MWDNASKDFQDNLIVYVLMIMLGVIIFSNIGIKIWQVSLEKQYGVRMENTKNEVTDYRESYYSEDKALDTFLVKLNDITNETKLIVKQNIISIVTEVIILAITFIPMRFMYQIFKDNRDISNFYPTETTGTIISIEIIVVWLTSIWDLKGAFAVIGKYRQIYGLVEEVLVGMGTLLDSINFQIQQY